MDPFDVFEAGRLTVLQDPTGAAAALWEPRSHFGAGIKYEPGAIAWCELMTTDPGAAAAFYTGLLGLQAEQNTMENGVEYTVLMTAGYPAAGIMALPDESTRQAGPISLERLLPGRRQSTPLSPPPLPGAVPSPCRRPTSPPWDASPWCSTRRARPPGSWLRTPAP